MLSLVFNYVARHADARRMAPYSYCSTLSQVCLSKHPAFDRKLQVHAKNNMFVYINIGLHILCRAG
jgi:hypothetical protein